MNRAGLADTTVRLVGLASPMILHVDVQAWHGYFGGMSDQADTLGTSLESCKEVKRIVDAIELRLHRGPIVAIQVMVGRTTAGVRVVTRVPDRTSPTEEIEIIFYGPSLVARTQWTVHEFARAIRETCRFALSHELDEGITVDGVRTFDPHGAVKPEE